MLVCCSSYVQLRAMDVVQNSLDTVHDTEELLISAAQNPDPSCLEQLIKNNIIKDIPNDKDFTPIFFIARYGTDKHIQVLIDNNFSVTKNAQNGHSPLHCAAENKNLSCLIFLLKQPYDKNTINSGGQTPVHHAIRYGFPANLKLLLDNDVTDNGLMKDGNTLLVLAARNPYSSCLEYLIENNYIQEKQVDKRGLMPIHIISLCGSDKHLQVLIENRFPIQVTTKKGDTALHVAMLNEDPSCLIWFLRHKTFAVDSKDKFGLPPIYYATLHGSLEHLQSLLTQNASNDVSFFDGRTLIHTAIFNPDHSILKFLLHQIADVHKGDNGGWRPIHYAARHGTHKHLQLLINAHAKLDESLDGGNTLLHLAALNEDTSALKLLVEEKSLKIDTKNNNGLTAIDFAAQYGSAKHLRLLQPRKNSHTKAEGTSQSQPLRHSPLRNCSLSGTSDEFQS